MNNLVNRRGIPEICPGCKRKDPSVKVTDYSMMWHDGKVVCADCGQFFRLYDAG